MGRLSVWLLPLLLAGCLTSKGRFLPADNAATPLPAGAYYRIEPGEPLPALAGPFNLSIKGKEYTFSSGRDVLKFQLIRLVEGKDIYVAQAAPDAKTDNVAILFGPLTLALSDRRHRPGWTSDPRAGAGWGDLRSPTPLQPIV